MAAVATSVRVGIDSAGAAKKACGGDDACDAAAATAADRDQTGNERDDELLELDPHWHGITPSQGRLMPAIFGKFVPTAWLSRERESPDPPGRVGSRHPRGGVS